MKTKKLILIPLFFIISLSAFSLTACNQSQSPEEKADWIVHKITKTIELNQDQVTKLEDVKNEMLRLHKEHKAKKAAVMDNLIVEIQKPSLDRQFLLDLVEQHKTNIDQAAPIIIDKIIIFHESLTSEQKLKTVEILNKFKKHHQNQAG